MINKKSFPAFKKFKNTQFFKPLYKNYSFANIPSTIYFLFTGKKEGGILSVDCFGDNYPKPKKIVLFFLDAFGFKLWDKYSKEIKVLNKITEEGIVTPISAIFPSSTAPSVSTLNLNVLPSKHALYEWYVYIEKYGQVIKSLPFAPLDVNASLDDCLKLGFNPELLLEAKETICEKLKKEKIKSYLFENENYIDSSYSKIIERGSTPVPYSTLEEGFEKIKNILTQEKEKTFTYFYWEGIDSAGHEHGLYSKEQKEQIIIFWQTFNDVLANFKKDKDTLFLFAADHGQIGVNPNETYYLNLEIPEIEGFMEVTEKSEIIYPSGAYRDVFLHIKKDKLEQAFNILSQKLKNTAKVMLVKEALEDGLFGSPPFNKEFLNRIGQILILPYENKIVWWFDESKFEIKHLALHGGLSQEEMMTVFCSY